MNSENLRPETDLREIPAVQVFASGKQTESFFKERGIKTVADLFGFDGHSSASIQKAIEGLRAAYLDGSMWQNQVALGESLAQYVSEAWRTLNGERALTGRDKGACETRSAIIQDRLGLSNDGVILTLLQTGERLKMTKQAVQSHELFVRQSLFRDDISPVLFNAFVTKLAFVFEKFGWCLSQTGLEQHVGEEFPWRGTKWSAIYNLARELKLPMEYDGHGVFAWDFEVKSAERFAAFTALLGASGVELDCFNYDKVRDGLLGVGVRDFTLAEYQFMSRRIVDEHFVGEDEGLPCWQTMARVLGITPVDTSSITRILTAVFKNEPHIFTKEELLKKCRDADPTIAWTAGKIRGAIDRRALGGGAVILRYDRGRRNGEKTTFTVDAYVSDADKNVAREAVETLSNYLRETAFPVVSIYKTYKDCVSKLSSGFPQLCFYELVRMLGKDKLNCREYPRVGALGVACEINAYGDAARKEFARLGQRKASLEQLKTFLVNALHEDPLLADQSVRLMGLQRVSDERNADYLL